MNKKVFVFLALVLLVIAIAQLSPPAAEIYKGYLASEIPPPPGCGTPLQTKVSPNGQVLAHECELASSGEQALFLLRQGESWRNLGNAPDFAPNFQGANVRFRSFRTDEFKDQLFALTTAGLEVTNDYVVVSTLQAPSNPNSSWGKIASAVVNTKSLEKKIITSSRQTEGAYWGSTSDPHVLDDYVYFKATFAPRNKIMKMSLLDGKTEELPTSEISTLLMDAWVRSDGSVLIFANGTDLWVHRGGKNTLLVKGSQGFPLSPTDFEKILVGYEVVSQSGEVYIGYRANGGAYRVFQLTDTDRLVHFASHGGSATYIGAFQIAPRASSKAGVLMISWDNINIRGSSYPAWPDSLWLKGEGVTLKKLTAYGDKVVNDSIYGLFEPGTALDDNGTLYFTLVNTRGSNRLVRLAKPQVASAPTAPAGTDIVLTGTDLFFPSLVTELKIGNSTYGCTSASNGVTCRTASLTAGKYDAIIRISDGKGGFSESAQFALTVTAPLKPTIRKFTATPNQVSVGTPVVLSWVVENATEITVTSVGNVDPVNSAEVSPASSTVYTITAKSAGGSVSDSKLVEVSDPRPWITSITDASTGLLEGIAACGFATITGVTLAPNEAVADSENQLVVNGAAVHLQNDEFGFGAWAFLASASPTKIVFKVPCDAPSGPLTVTAHNMAGFESSPFTVTVFPAPKPVETEPAPEPGPAPEPPTEPPPADPPATTPPPDPPPPVEE